MIQREGHDRLGEGLLWSARDNAVYWTDISGQCLNRLNLGNDLLSSWPMPDTIGWVIERDGHSGFIAGLGDQIVALETNPIEITAIAAPHPGISGMRMNDALADASGRIWAGTVLRSCDQPVGALFRLDTDGLLTCLDTGYIVANGPAISADGSWLYHCDSGRGTVYRFTLSSEGAISRREVFLQFPSDWGVPDGMVCDSDGGLWIAHWGGGCVSRFDAQGQRDRVVALPATQITNVAFAGPRLDRMFVTSAADGVDEPMAGALFEIAPGCRGVPTYQFRG